MAMEPDRFEKVPALYKKGKPLLNKLGKQKMVPLTWSFDYRVIYFWTSQYVHVTIDSLDNHAAVPDEVFRVYMEGRRASLRKTDFGELALFNTLVYMHKILIAAFRVLGHTYQQTIAQNIEQFLNSLVH